jgi:hypothetical protein
LVELKLVLGELGDFGLRGRCVGSEVFTAVVMKSIIFWDMPSCSAFNALHGVISQKMILFNGRCVSSISYPI